MISTPFFIFAGIGSYGRTFSSGPVVHQASDGAFDGRRPKKTIGIAANVSTNHRCIFMGYAAQGRQSGCLMAIESSWTNVRSPIEGILMVLPQSVKLPV